MKTDLLQCRFSLRSIAHGFVVLAVAVALIGCGAEPSDPLTSDPDERVGAFDPYSVPLDDPRLIEGREIWMGTCADCHLTGLGDAPVVGDLNAWMPRIQKGTAELYQHAIDGFYGAIGEMPARGGNALLNDEEVRMAVDFVLHVTQRNDENKQNP